MLYQKDTIKSTKSGAAKYPPDVKIEELERYVYKNGQLVTNGKTWKVMDMGDVVGVSEGKVYQWVRVEFSGVQFMDIQFQKMNF